MPSVTSRAWGKVTTDAASSAKLTNTEGLAARAQAKPKSTASPATLMSSNGAERRRKNRTSAHKPRCGAAVA